MTINDIRGLLLKPMEMDPFLRMNAVSLSSDISAAKSAAAPANNNNNNKPG
jgi:hypothetical protein